MGRTPCTIAGMRGCRCLRGAVVLAGLIGLGHAPALAQVQLRCDVTYAGATRTLLATPVTDPYSVPSVDIRGRFHFKAVVVGESERIDHIQLYVYQRNAGQPVLVQQAKYLPPFHWPADGTPLPLTGQQYLYAGPVERELMYHCTLHREAP